MTVASLLLAAKRRVRPRNLAFAVRHGADARSKLDLRRLRGAQAQPRLVRIRLHDLGGAQIVIRDGSSDPDTLYETFAGCYHLPPPEAGATVMSILDLGSNIGLTVGHLAHLYPAARVLGVEMDREAARLARANIATWKERAEVRHAAVWIRAGTVRYRGRPGREHGLRVEEIAYPDDVAWGEAPASTLDDLVAEAAGPDGILDYLKMDVEGAEGPLLEHAAGWAGRVRAIKVEVHEPYTPAACSTRLRELGFEVRIHERNRDCVIAWRAGALRTAG